MARFKAPQQCNEHHSSTGCPFVRLGEVLRGTQNEIFCAPPYIVWGGESPPFALIAKHANGSSSVVNVGTAAFLKPAHNRPMEIRTGYLPDSVLPVAGDTLTITVIDRYNLMGESLKWIVLNGTAEDKGSKNKCVASSLLSHM